MSSCTACGAHLSRFRSPDEPEGLCALCARQTAPEEAQGRILEHEDLTLAIAGVLLLRRAIAPDEKVHLQAELEALGIVADHVDVHKGVEKLRRRYGWHVDAVEGRPGYQVRRWPFRFHRRPRRGQLSLI